MKLTQRIVVGFAALMVVMASLFGVATLTQPVYAANTDTACEGVKLAGGTCDKTTADAGVKKVITTIVDVLSVIVGAVSVIMIIIGGLRYIISSGDSSSTAAARNTIIYALVGLVVVIFAQAIVGFVIGRVKE